MSISLKQHVPISSNTKSLLWGLEVKGTCKIYTEFQTTYRENKFWYKFLKKVDTMYLWMLFNFGKLNRYHLEAANFIWHVCWNIIWQTDFLIIEWVFLNQIVNNKIIVFNISFLIFFDWKNKYIFISFVLLWKLSV